MECTKELVGDKYFVPALLKPLESDLTITSAVEHWKMMKILYVLMSDYNLYIVPILCCCLCCWMLLFVVVVVFFKPCFVAAVIWLLVALHIHEDLSGTIFLQDFSQGC